MNDNDRCYLVIQYKNEIPLAILNEEQKAEDLVKKINQKKRIVFYQEVDCYLLSFMADIHKEESIHEIYDLHRFIDEEQI